MPYAGSSAAVTGTRPCSPGSHSRDKDTNYTDNVNKILCEQSEGAVNSSCVNETTKKM